MTAALAEVLPVSAPTARAHLLNVYYYPGRTLQAVHRLGDGVVVTLEAVPVGAPAEQRLGLPLPEHLLPSTAVSVFPLDPGLPWLPALLHESGPEPDLLTYLPGRRCVLGTPNRVAKMAAPGTVAAAHARQLALWSAPQRRFRVAQPLALDAARGVRWEQRVAGDRVQQRLPGVAAPALAALLCSELAALHALPLHGLDLTPLGAPELLGRLQHKTLRTLARALPHQAARAGELVAHLAADLPRSSQPGVVHGDCHLANMLVDDEGVHLLDLDELGVGDPELDLAQFATRALLVALHTGSGLERAAEVAEVLPQAYEQAAHRRVDPATYAWYVATCLAARQVKTSVRHLAPDLDRLVGRLLALAEAVVRSGRVDRALLVGEGAPA